MQTTDGAPLAYRVSPFIKAIGISRTTFYELMAAGKIRTIVIGGRRLIPADEARRLVRDGCGTSQPVRSAAARAAWQARRAR